MALVEMNEIMNRFMIKFAWHYAWNTYGFIINGDIQLIIQSQCYESLLRMPGGMQIVVRVRDGWKHPILIHLQVTIKIMIFSM